MPAKPAKVSLFRPDVGIVPHHSCDSWHLSVLQLFLDVKYLCRSSFLCVTKKTGDVTKKNGDAWRQEFLSMYV